MQGVVVTGSYSRPPIVEGIIEILWTTPLSDSSLRRAQKNAKPRFSTEEEEVELEVRFDGPNPSVVEQGVSSYRYRSADSADILIIRRRGLIVSRLAPYTGWTALSGRAVEELGAIRQAGHDAPNRSRIGVRFINRIDIPSQGGVIFPDNYVLGIPKRPDILKTPAAEFSTHFARAPVGGFFVNVNLAKQPSPILNHVGLVLDIDVYSEGDSPLARIQEDLAAIHDIKNEVFEGMITDQARGLFQ